MRANKLKHMSQRNRDPSGPRTTQKAFTFGKARDPFEQWCRIHGYDQNVVVLAGWLTLCDMPHAKRMKRFAALRVATDENFTRLIAEEEASPNLAQPRPAASTSEEQKSRGGSRRAG